VSALNRVMTGLGYFYVIMFVSILIKRWYHVKFRLWWLKYSFERKHGKGSYAAVEFLYALRKMTAEREENS
jgi:hypothetical protein